MENPTCIQLSLLLGLRCAWKEELVLPTMRCHSYRCHTCATLNMLTTRGGGGGGKRGHSTKFYTGRLHPEVQTLTLLYTIFDRKGTLFIYLPRKMVPLLYSYGATLLNFSLE